MPGHKTGLTLARKRGLCSSSSLPPSRDKRWLQHNGWILEMAVLPLGHAGQRKGQMGTVFCPVQVRMCSPATTIGCRALRRVIVWKKTSSRAKCSRATANENRVAPAADAGLLQIARSSSIPGGIAAVLLRQHRVSNGGMQSFDRLTIDGRDARVFGTDEAQSTGQQSPHSKHAPMELRHCRTAWNLRLQV